MSRRRSRRSLRTRGSARPRAAWAALARDGARRGRVAGGPPLHRGPGAHAGAGLGDRFLRHIERTKLLIHLVDVSGLAQDPISDYQTVTRELDAYSREVAAKPKIVVASKLDALDDATRLNEFEEFCQRERLEFYSISAASGKGLKELLRAVEQKLDVLKQEEVLKREEEETVQAAIAR